MDIRNLTVVLLAGDPKCLRRISGGDGSYLRRAYQAALALGCRIVFVHHPDVTLPHDQTSLVTKIPAGKRLFDSVSAGVMACQTEYILVLSTDLPLVVAEPLRELFQHACLTDTDVSIALARLTACHELGYGTRHPIPLAGEQYKFGSAFVIRRQAREQVLAAIRDLLDLRKQPIRLVRKFLSWRFLVPAIRYMFSNAFLKLSLSYDEAERLVREQVGIRARVFVAHPCLAIDDD